MAGCSPEPVADERLLGVIGSETRDQVDLVAESSHVIRAGEDSSRLTLELHVPRRDHGILGGLAQRHAIVVLVDDRLAYDEDLERPERGQCIAHRAGTVTPPEALEEVPCRRLASSSRISGPAHEEASSRGSRKWEFSSAVEENTVSWVNRTSPPTSWTAAISRRSFPLCLTGSSPTWPLT